MFCHSLVKCFALYKGITTLICFITGQRRIRIDSTLFLSADSWREQSGQWSLSESEVRSHLDVEMSTVTGWRQTDVNTWPEAGSWVWPCGDLWPLPDRLCTVLLQIKDKCRSLHLPAFWKEAERRSSSCHLHFKSLKVLFFCVPCCQETLITTSLQ